jgi:hypothetical protein
VHVVFLTSKSSHFHRCPELTTGSPHAVAPVLTKRIETFSTPLMEDIRATYNTPTAPQLDCRSSAHDRANRPSF